MLYCKNWLGELNSSKNVSRIICTHISEKKQMNNELFMNLSRIINRKSADIWLPICIRNICILNDLVILKWCHHNTHNQEYISLHITAFTAHAKHKFLLYLDLDGGKFRMCACLLIWCLSQLVVSPTIPLPRAVGRSENPRGASNNLICQNIGGVALPSLRLRQLWIPPSWLESN